MRKDLRYTITYEHLERGVNLSGKMGIAFQVGLEKGMMELARRIEHKLYEYMSMYDVNWSGAQLTVYANYIRGEIIFGVAHHQAVYLEYGTGFVGANSPHPTPHRAGWAYASGEKSSQGKGWWYRGGIDPSVDPDVIWYGGSYAYTKGRPSRPFLYYTWLWARRSGHQIIRKHIRMELARVRI